MFEQSIGELTTKMTKITGTKITLIVRQTGEMERPEDKPTDIWACKTGGWMDRGMDGWMDREMDGQINKQVIRWTDRQARLTTDRNSLTARRMDR